MTTGRINQVTIVSTARIVTIVTIHASTDIMCMINMKIKIVFRSYNCLIIINQPLATILDICNILHTLVLCVFPQLLPITETTLYTTHSILHIVYKHNTTQLNNLPINDRILIFEAPSLDLLLLLLNPFSLGGGD
jgi:hypothetical protein